MGSLPANRGKWRDLVEFSRPLLGLLLPIVSTHLLPKGKVHPTIDSKNPPESDTATRAAIPVAGIGASAGGLEVFKRLLGLLPGDTGFAIVFVQHLDPNHHSMLAKILARATAMPVSEAADGMAVEANHVYVIPANVDLTIAGGVLNLTPRTQRPGFSG